MNQVPDSKRETLVESAYQNTHNVLLDLAKQAPFRPGENLDDIWDSLSEEQKVQAGATERFRLEFEATIASALKNWQPPHQIGGRLDARALGRSQHNIENLIDECQFLLAPDSSELLERFNRENHALVDTCLKQRTLQGVPALDMHIILEDWVKKLIYLELVSRQRRQGDRGIRYVYGLIEHGEQFLKTFKAYPDFTPKEQFCLRLIQVHQNLGFTAYAARCSYRGGKLYRAYGARIFTDEINRYRQVLTHKEAELIRNAIVTQRTPEFPFQEERVLAAARLAYFLSPFNPYAVHLRIQNVTDALDYLQDMRERIENNDLSGLQAAQDAFARFLRDDANLSQPLSEDMMAAFFPYTLSQEALQNTLLNGITNDLNFADDHTSLTLKIGCSEYQDQYNTLFAIGQERIKELLELGQAKENNNPAKQSETSISPKSLTINLS